ncbi:hypothetical protein DFP72DRAFT_1076302 [Ephemerocybe angulata]|uniref:Uncharacterized protein n=1 Tax=Ephemerocybe angulata TaxID=980116 RepID=A0A8H6HHF0_9AGAR|nr:hypothetical protein DFP72DRAFT_1076302 [Tulosesus angulatus]
MRFASILALIPLALSLGLLANAYDDTVDRREYIEELSTREDYSLLTREILSDLSTRELMDELSDRLDRRGKYTCRVCGTTFSERPSGSSAVCKREKIPHTTFKGPNGKYTCTTCGRSWNTPPKGMEAVCRETIINHQLQ